MSSSVQYLFSNLCIAFPTWYLRSDLIVLRDLLSLVDLVNRLWDHGRLHGSTITITRPGFHNRRLHITSKIRSPFTSLEL